MKLIADLGMRDDAFNPSSGNMMKARWYSFECPQCNKIIELRGKRALKQKTCKACRGTQNIKHGMAGHPIYHVYQAMHQRCYNSKNAKYHIYGGRGISICKDWHTFEKFWEDNKQYYAPGLSIDRYPDGDGNYEPNNIRWIPTEKNSSETNKRRPVIQLRKVLLPALHYVEVRKWDSAKQAADELGLIPNAITAVCSTHTNHAKNITHGGFKWEYTE